MRRATGLVWTTATRGSLGSRGATAVCRCVDATVHARPISSVVADNLTGGGGKQPYTLASRAAFAPTAASDAAPHLACLPALADRGYACVGAEERSKEEAKVEATFTTISKFWSVHRSYLEADSCSMLGRRGISVLHHLSTCASIPLLGSMSQTRPRQPSTRLRSMSTRQNDNAYLSPCAVPVVASRGRSRCSWRS